MKVKASPIRGAGDRDQERRVPSKGPRGLHRLWATSLSSERPKSCPRLYPPGARTRGCSKSLLPFPSDRGCPGALRPGHLPPGAGRLVQGYTWGSEPEPLSTEAAECGPEGLGARGPPNCCKLKCHFFFNFLKNESTVDLQCCANCCCPAKESSQKDNVLIL